MSIDVETQVTIARPRSDVAAVMFDPTHDAIWTSGVVEVRPLTGGPHRAGSRVERVVRFAGRTFAYVYEVIAADGSSFVEMTVDKPFPMKVRYELADAPGVATLARIRTSGDPGGFFSLAGPLLAPMVRRNITKDLELLKAHVERRP